MGLLNTNTVHLSAPADTDTEPPVFWWFNGNKQAKTPGCFYIKADALATRPDAPWAVDDRFDGETGFSTKALRIAYIGHRSQAFIEDDSGGYKKKVWLKHYEKGARFQTEILCFAEGIEGPVVLSVKGLTGKAFTAKTSSILSAYKNGLLREGSRLEERQLPVWAFWMPISTLLDAGGKIAYQDTGFGSHTTPPSLFVPDLGEATVTKLFVGLELLKAGDDARIAYDAWLRAQRGNVAPEPAPAAVVAVGWDAGDGDIEF